MKNTAKTKQKVLACFMSAVFALGICLPGGVVRAWAEGGGADIADATVSEGSAGETLGAGDSSVAADSGESEAAVVAGEAFAPPAVAKAPAQPLTGVTVDDMAFSPASEGGQQTGGYALMGYTGTSSTLDIPAAIIGSDGNEHPVTHISANLQYSSGIEHVVIPDSVVNISNSAFAGCVNLKDVRIGSGVAALTYAFNGCTSLAQVTFAPNSALKKIDGGFNGCTGLAELSLPEGLEEVSLSGTGLIEIALPSTVTKIYNYGFSESPQLEKVSIPDGVTELGDSTFFKCPNLTTITGGASITKIGENCFGGPAYNWDTGAWDWPQDAKLTSLGDIDFKNITAFGEYAFYGAPNVESQDVSLESVTKLGKSAFYNCNWITKLAIGDNLAAIPQNAFAYCYGIKDIVLSNGVKLIGDEAFVKVDATAITIGSSNGSQLASVGSDAFADSSAGSAITINTAESDVNLKEDSFGALDEVTWTVPSVDETGKVLYLDGASGDDANDATSKGKAVKTFARAKELATANQDILYINVIGTVNASGEMSLEGTKAMLRRDADFAGYLLQVVDGDTATLKTITVDGNERKANAEQSLIYVKGGVLNVQEGAALQHNKLTDLGWQRAWGGAVLTDNSTEGSVINMTGGVIRDNTANLGGGICLDYGSTFNMFGGSIENNHAITGTTGGALGHAAGGGVAFADKGSKAGQPVTFNLSGGAIKGNSSQDMGGGISVGYGGAMFSQPVLNMTGGDVCDNTAGSCGGGIFVQYGYDDGGANSANQAPARMAARAAVPASGGASYGIANISGGSIADNKTTGAGHGNKEFGGGGIYVNGGAADIGERPSHKAVLNLTNALITQNTAAQEGGGYAACPVSETYIYVNNGAAIYGNAGSAAKDLYILASLAYGDHSGDPVYVISSSMLGGTPYNWKYESNKEVPLDRLAGTLTASANEELSLHTDVSSDERAQALAQVTISGNASATRGGGIGSNGTVNIGTSDTTEVAVDKTWDDAENAMGSRPESVIVELYRAVKDSKDDPVYLGFETMHPDDEGNWSLTFKNLPKTDSDKNEYVYSVKERLVDGYTAGVVGDQAAGFTITNALDASITVAKVWADDNDHDGMRPAAIVVNLMRDGDVIDSVTVTPDEQGMWTCTFKNLPQYNPAGDHRYVYTVSEDEVAGYTSAVSGDAATGFTVTNTREPQVPPEKPTPSTPSPQSGDQDMLAPLGLLALASLLALGGASFALRRNHRLAKRYTINMASPNESMR